MILTAVQKTCKWSLPCQQMLTEAHRGPSGVLRDLLASFHHPHLLFIIIIIIICLFLIYNKFLIFTGVSHQADFTHRQKASV